MKKGGDWMLVANTESVAPPPRKVSEIYARIYDSYVGEYRGKFGAGDITITVRRDGDRLFVLISGQSEFEIRPESETVFFDEDEAADWIFERGTDGRATAFIYRSGGTDLRFERSK